MITDASLQLAPPWGSQAAWQEAHGSIDYHLRRYQEQLRPVETTAREARLRLESMFPLQDDLCAATCTWCPDPCCLTASPWYDFRDLIYSNYNIEMIETLLGNFAETEKPVLWVGLF